MFPEMAVRKSKICSEAKRRGCNWVEFSPMTEFIDPPPNFLCFIQSNSVLDAFENVKTDKDKNSCRFGKFVEIFSLTNLELLYELTCWKDHMFSSYMLCVAPEEDVKRFKLGDPKTYHYLNQPKSLPLDSIIDSEKYHATRKAMDVIGSVPKSRCDAKSLEDSLCKRIW